MSDPISQNDEIYRRNGFGRIVDLEDKVIDFENEIYRTNVHITKRQTIH